MACGGLGLGPGGGGHTALRGHAMSAYSVPSWADGKPQASSDVPRVYESITLRSRPWG